MIRKEYQKEYKKNQQGHRVQSGGFWSRQGGRLGKAPGCLTAQRTFKLWPRSGKGRANPHSNLLWVKYHPCPESCLCIHRPQKRGNCAAQMVTLHPTLAVHLELFFPCSLLAFVSSRMKLQSFESSPLAFPYLRALRADEGQRRLGLRLIHVSTKSEEILQCLRHSDRWTSPPAKERQSLFRLKCLARFCASVTQLSLLFFKTTWLLRHIFLFNHQDPKETFKNVFGGNVWDFTQAQCGCWAATLSLGCSIIKSWANDSTAAVVRPHH